MKIGTKGDVSKASRAREEQTPNPIDLQVGARIRLRRNMLGLSEEYLGEAIGLTFQQVQKYERGASRIGASRLHELSRVLDVPVSFFFDDLDHPVWQPLIPRGSAEHSVRAFASDPERSTEAFELLTAYNSIDDPDVRRRLRDLADALSGSDQPRHEDDEARSDVERPEREIDWFGPAAAEIGLAFKTAADQLLATVEQTLTEARAEREKTREILDRLDERLAPHG